MAGDATAGPDGGDARAGAGGVDAGAGSLGRPDGLDCGAASSGGPDGPDSGAGTPAESVVAPGRYRHYKGPEYEVVGEARHSETEEALVVYRALYGERGLWVRPRAMWLETVEVDGTPRPRFARIDAA